MLRLLLASLLTGMLAPELPAQTPRSNVADSLMERWVQIYNGDDVEALREFYAEDVVTVNDAGGTAAEGREAVLAGSRARMAETHGLDIQPLYSYEEDDLAYHVGRWVIHAPNGWVTGTHTFIFQRTPDGPWKLKSTYYTHDPVARLDEFPAVPK